MFFYAALTFAIFIFQTAAAPVLFREGLYDLFFPLIFHMGLTLPLKKALLLTLASGFLSDSLSSAPFGICISSHIWYLLLLRWGLGFLHVRNPLFLPPVLCLGILMQETLFAAAHLLSGTQIFPPEIWKTAGMHILWAGLTAPFLVTGISVLRRHWHTQIKKIFPSKKTQKQ